MPGGMFWGGLTQGLAQGFQRADDMRRRKEQLKLEQRKLQLEEDTQKEKLNQLRDVMTGRRQAADLYEQQATGATPGSTQVETETGDQPIGLQVTGQPGGPKQQRPMSLRDILTKQSIMEGKFPSELFKTDQAQRMINVGPSGTVFDPNTRQEVYRNPTERSGVGAESQLFAQFMAQMRSEGMTDPEVIRQRWQSVLSGNAAARSSGGESGKLDVRTTPKYLQNQTDTQTARTAGQPVPESADAAMTSMRTILQQLDRVNPENPKSLYNEKYVGPLAGRYGGLKETFGETPYVGALVGGPISENEAQFRQAVNSIYNEIANLRGGKVLPEQELKRIEKEATTLTQSPTSFRSRYKGFRTMIEGMLKNRMGNVGATRGSVGGSVPQQPSSPTRLKFNPATGQIE